ncbi:MAG TPA: acyl-CoA dehydratase activase-related protein [Symbiobacteriaceae bacterium]|nr:acyl-CoA dehydratase activase-related protein [Symbiobacteriaceae bacterium]
MRIGIPRTLWYYTCGPFWRQFFSEIGAEVVLSPFTTRSVLDDGVAACVSKACLPIKVFFGHLKALAGRVDYPSSWVCLTWSGTAVWNCRLCWKCGWTAARTGFA